MKGDLPFILVMSASILTVGLGWHAVIELELEYLWSGALGAWHGLTMFAAYYVGRAQ